MTLIWHIIRKDLRLLWWVLTVFLVLSLADTINRVVGPRFLAEDERWMFILPMWTFIIGVAYALQLTLLTANQIQAERLVGTTAFWLTRPIPRGLLLRSKLLGLTLFVLLPTLIVEIILMAAFQVPAATIVFAAIQQAWVMALLLLALVFLATLTATATRMLFLLVGGLVALYFVFMIALSVSVSQATFEVRGPETGAVDPSSTVVEFTVLGIAMLVAIWHHYTHRRPMIAVALLAGGIAVASLIGTAWPNVSLFGGVPTLDDQAWARDATLTKLRLTSKARMFGESRGFSGGRFGQRLMTQLAAPVVLDGLPPLYSAEPFTIAAEVRFADGQTVRSLKAGPQQHPVPLDPVAASAAADAAVPPTPGPRDYVRQEKWPTLMLAPVESFTQYGDRTGAYSATFVYVVHRNDPLTVVPLAEGFAYRDGARSLLVSKLRYDIDACLVTFRVTGVGLLPDQLSQTTLVPRFRQRDGLDLKDQRGGFLHGSINVGGPLFMPHLLQQFDLDYRVSRPVRPFYDEMHANGPPCELIDLVIERRSFAGTLTRTLELADFRLNDGRPATPAHAQDLMGLH